MPIALCLVILVVAVVAYVAYVEEVNLYSNTIGGNGESFVDSMYEGINDVIESVETIIAVEVEIASYIVEAVNNDVTDEGDSKTEVQNGNQVEVDTQDLDKVDEKYLKKKGLDAHKIKEEVYGKNAKKSLYDIYVNKKTGELYTQRKPKYNVKNEAAIPIGEYIK